MVIVKWETKLEIKKGSMFNKKILLRSRDTD